MHLVAYLYIYIINRFTGHYSGDRQISFSAFLSSGYVISSNNKIRKFLEILNIFDFWKFSDFFENSWFSIFRFSRKKIPKKSIFRKSPQKFKNRKFFENTPKIFESKNRKIGNRNFSKYLIKKIQDFSYFIFAADHVSGT